MAGTYTNLLYHIVFSTKERRRLITPTIEDELHKYIGGIVRKFEGVLLEANGDMDHLHLLLVLKPKFALSDIVRDIKANSAAWLNDKARSPYKFGWQDGYAAFTVSESQQPRVAGQRRVDRRCCLSFDNFSTFIEGLSAALFLPSATSRLQATPRLCGPPQDHTSPFLLTQKKNLRPRPEPLLRPRLTLTRIALAAHRPLCRILPTTSLRHCDRVAQIQKPEICTNAIIRR